MNAVARTRPRTRTNKFERPVSDMAHELLVRIIGGLGTTIVLDRRDREVLYHYLFGRNPEQVAAELGLRDTTVHKHLHRVFLRTGVETRRGLLELGRELSELNPSASRSARMPRPRALAA